MAAWAGGEGCQIVALKGMFRDAGIGKGGWEEHSHVLLDEMREQDFYITSELRVCGRSEITPLQMS